MSKDKFNLIMCAPGHLHCNHLICLVPSMKFASLNITFLFVLTAYKKIKKVKGKECHISMNGREKEKER